MKLNLLYYKNVLDIAIVDFFDAFNDDFVKINGYYVLGASGTKAQLKKFFVDRMSIILRQYLQKWDITNPSYNLIIGSCMPSDNILLDFKKKNEYFPDKLDSLINSNIKLKYVIKEDDIKLDIILINQIFIDIFNEMFSNPTKVVSLLGKEFANTFFVQHHDLDCYTMFKTIKFLYGKTSCVNVWKNIANNDIRQKDALVSINELICKYINNKNELNKSQKFKEKVYEVKTFIDNLLNQ